MPENCDSLKEYLESQIAALKELYINNRESDQRALGAALTAQKEAISKAEAAQTAYNLSHNDLIRKAEKLAELTMPRQEIESRIYSTREHADSIIKSLNERITKIERSESHNTGGNEALAKSKENALKFIGLIIAIAGIIITLIIKFI